MYFRKYEFLSEADFDILVESIPTESNQTIVKLGELVPEKFCVDILWENEILVDWTEYEIWDINGNGSHTFSGWEFGKDLN